MISNEDEHCKDCCCARAWKALGIESYTGKSIPEHIEELRRRLLELEEANRWRLVSAEPPEDKGYYQVIGGTGPLRTPYTARFLMGKDGQEWWWACARFDPTHWRPLPTPPATEDRGMKPAQEVKQ